MSFLKSYYNSVSSYIVGNEDDDTIKEDLSKENPDEECKVKESKSVGWLSGIYYDAYNNSGEMWKAVKTDLGEFASVISKDAKTVVVKTANGLKHGLIGDDENIENASVDDSYSTTSKIKAGINRMLEQVSKTLYIPPDSDDEDYYYNNDNKSQIICSRIDNRITKLQNDQNTFVTDPSSSELDADLGDFLTWKEKLNMDDFQTTIAELVKSNQGILDNFTELVPDKVKFDDFWARYFYRVASVKAEESRREALKLRIGQDENIIDNTDSGDWDDGNDINEEPCALPEYSVLIEADKITKTVHVPQVDLDSSLIKNSEELLKITEKDDVIVVKHSIESSSASEDNNQPELSNEQKEIGDFVGWDDDDDEDMDVNVTEEDLELAKKVSDKEVLEISTLSDDPSKI